MVERVLVVDDSSLMRVVIKDLMAADDAFEVVGEAVDGHEALSQARELKPDLILLDIEMPRMNGIEALKRLSLLSTAPVVIVSSAAQVGSDQALEALRLGAAAVVAKPSGALSLDLEAKRGHEIVRAARQAVGLDGA
ncbi:MAG: response regulator [Alphaproteobacteria bacterium]|jgi:two-component system chemotaxis response regulator CheB|nr:response regulator [Rhodospirillaceae bacterium]MDG2481463.1 response regulator [Alphaproteobacteria bacterium]MBT6203688.1 response regulator [Rhodospirillaceae bacterium]MBT6512146.1 response regulator [Rhodospirillaceae bacterium]MBT7614254.1 response regulator [Rhodospirillaceae bacterium]